MFNKFLILITVIFLLYTYYQFIQFDKDIGIFYEKDPMTIGFAILIIITGGNLIIQELIKKNKR